MVLISGEVRFLHDLILGQETNQIEFHFLLWEEEKRRLHSDTSSGVERPQSEFRLNKGSSNVCFDEKENNLSYILNMPEKPKLYNVLNSCE